MNTKYENLEFGYPKSLEDLKSHNVMWREIWDKCDKSTVSVGLLASEEKHLPAPCILDKFKEIYREYYQESSKPRETKKILFLNKLTDLNFVAD